MNLEKGQIVQNQTLRRIGKVMFIGTSVVVTLVILYVVLFFVALSTGDIQFG